MTSTANNLRQAAEALRCRAGFANGDPEFWTPSGIVSWACDGGVLLAQDERDAAYIAAMHPGVGLALADWLDDEALMNEATGRVTSSAAVNLANIVKSFGCFS